MIQFIQKEQISSSSPRSELQTSLSLSLCVYSGRHLALQIHGHSGCILHFHLIAVVDWSETRRNPKSGQGGNPAERQVCQYGPGRAAQPGRVRHHRLPDVQCGKVELRGGHHPGRLRVDFWSDGGIWAFTEAASESIRGKKDVWNSAIGGAAAGSILGLRAGKLPVGLVAAAALAAGAVFIDVGGQTVRTPTGREYLPYPRTNPDL